MLVVAYIGFGVSVREYHIPYVEDRDDVRVKYVYRRMEDRIGDEACEAYYPEIIFTSDINDIYNDPEVNLVVVNTPDKFHVPYAMEILNHGKHALIEKPFAATAAEAKQVFDLAKEKGLIVTSNQNRRYDADMLCVKSVLDRGVLGELVKFESHYDYYRPQGWYHYFGVLYNLAVHTIDQVISLFGKPDWTNYDVRSIIFPGEADDYYDLEFHYGKLKATVNTSMLCAIDYPRFTVHGTKGSLTLPPVLHNSSKKKTEGRFKANRQPAGEDRWGTLVYFDDEGIRHEEKVPVGCAHYERVYENLIDCICNGGEKAIKDEEVITVLEILEEATAVAKKWSK